MKRFIPRWLMVLGMAGLLMQAAQAFDYTTTLEFHNFCVRNHLSDQQRDALASAISDECGEIAPIFSDERGDVYGMLSPTQKDIYDTRMGPRAQFPVALLTTDEFKAYQVALRNRLMLSEGRAHAMADAQARTLAALTPIQSKYEQRYMSVLNAQQLADLRVEIAGDCLAYIVPLPMGVVSRTDVIESKTQTTQTVQQNQSVTESTTTVTPHKVTRTYAVKTKKKKNWRNQDLK